VLNAKPLSLVLLLVIFRCQSSCLLGLSIYLLGPVKMLIFLVNLLLQTFIGFKKRIHIH
jgi:hypothetical protein